jgi:hypothetical protein
MNEVKRLELGSLSFATLIHLLGLYFANCYIEHERQPQNSEKTSEKIYGF